MLQVGRGEDCAASLPPERRGEEQDDGEEFQTACEHGQAGDPLAEVGQGGPGEGWAGEAKARAAVAEGGDGGAEGGVGVEALELQDEDADDGQEDIDKDEGQHALHVLARH